MNEWVDAYGLMDGWRNGPIGISRYREKEVRWKGGWTNK